MSRRKISSYYHQNITRPKSSSNTGRNAQNTLSASKTIDSRLENPHRKKFKKTRKTQFHKNPIGTRQEAVACARGGAEKWRPIGIHRALFACRFLGMACSTATCGARPPREKRNDREISEHCKKKLKTAVSKDRYTHAT